MIRIGKIHSNTDGNSHRVRNVLLIIMSLYMLIDIEVLFAVSFGTQRDNQY
jgi:hypothetical protein